MTPRRYVVICSVVLFSIFLPAAWLFSKEAFDVVPNLEDNDKTHYILRYTELIPREDICKFAVDNGKIYILYDETALVNVYGADGAFQYGIQFSTIANGRSDIAVTDGKLYFYSRRPIVFVFDGTQLIETLDPYSDQDEYLTLRPALAAEKNASDYQISASGNDIINRITQKTIIDFPEQSETAERLLIWGVFLLGLSFLGYSHLFTKHIR